MKQLNFLFFFKVVVVISSSIELGGSEVLYITTSSCHVKPCLTLYQFAANTSCMAQTQHNIDLFTRKPLTQLGGQSLRCI